MFVRQSPDLTVDSCIIQGTGQGLTAAERMPNACKFLQRN
jgi:hypothetical protein